MQKNPEAATTEAATTTPDTSPFFNSVRALARYLACDEVTIRRMMRRKALPFIKLGGRYLFRKTEVEEVLSRHHVAAVRPRRAE
jgi:excisionase family DNA binding protein